MKDFFDYKTVIKPEEEVPEKDRFLSKTIQTLVEMFKIKNGRSHVIVSDIFLAEMENIKTLRNKIYFLYLLNKRHIVAMKAYLT